MSKLTHKNYKPAITAAEKVVVDVKEQIRAFVGEGSKRYEEIENHIMKSNHILRSDVKAQIRLVSKESDYIKPIIEEPVKEIVEEK